MNPSLRFIIKCKGRQHHGNAQSDGSNTEVALPAQQTKKLVQCTARIAGAAVFVCTADKKLSAKIVVLLNAQSDGSNTEVALPAQQTKKLVQCTARIAGAAVFVSTANNEGNARIASPWLSSQAQQPLSCALV